MFFKICPEWISILIGYSSMYYLNTLTFRPEPEPSCEKQRNSCPVSST